MNYFLFIIWNNNNLSDDKHKIFKRSDIARKVKITMGGEHRHSLHVFSFILMPFGGWG